MSVIGSQLPGTTYRSINSRPMWVCHESGGCPPCNRVCNTAFALTPAPPVTVELTTSTPGLAAVKASKRACSAFDSPGDVHHEKISSESSACAAARRDPSRPSPTAPTPSAAPPLRTPRRDARDANLVVNSCTGYSFSVAERSSCAIARPHARVASDRLAQGDGPQWRQPRGEIYGMYRVCTWP